MGRMLSNAAGVVKIFLLSYKFGFSESTYSEKKQRLRSSSSAMPLTLRQIRYFVAVAETGKIAAAGEAARTITQAEMHSPSAITIISLSRM